MSREIPRRLNLGCGLKKKPDCLNVDLRGEPDLVLDLDRHPWPLPRNHFEHVWALDVVEHLADLPAFMKDVHAVLAPGGTVEITTPHFSCANAYTDPTHRHHLGYFSFDYFTDASQWSFYTEVRFEIVERILVFHPGRLDGLVSRFANRRPALYEKRLAWLWPAWFLLFKLRKV